MWQGLFNYAKRSKLNKRIRISQLEAAMGVSSSGRDKQIWRKTKWHNSATLWWQLSNATSHSKAGLATAHIIEFICLGFWFCAFVKVF